MKPSIQPEPALTTLRAAIGDLLVANRCKPTPELLDAILAVCGANTLTERHGDVLRLALAGRNDKEISDELSIHENTLQLHWREIRARVGIVSRFQLGSVIAFATCGSPQVVSREKIKQSDGRKMKS